MTSATLQLAQQLIARPSITPDDAGCQLLIQHHLQNLGFSIEHLPCAEVDNLWAVHGETGPCLVFAGHTDVVPPGPLEQWSSPPFKPTIRQHKLYGRGAADMKGSIAAMLTAVERLLSKSYKLKGRIAFLITSDEEGPAEHGTRHVVETLQRRGVKLDYCLVGEPSSTQQLGDIIKHGRRGSLSGHLEIIGKQGHIAYPDQANNPIHLALAALQSLLSEVWDHGNDDFPPTSLQFSNLHAGTGALNVIPGKLNADFNFRFSAELKPETIKQRVVAALEQANIEYNLQWRLSGLPFLTPAGELRDAVSHAVQQVTGRTPKSSTGGGTSDGRFIAPMGTQVIELGPCNATIHQIDECVAVDELDALSEIYEHIIIKLLT